jgi:hypothetical protein
MIDIYDYKKPRKNEKFHFVDFVFSIPARGMTEQEVREYAVEKFVDESYDIMKGLRRYPDNSTIGEKIEEIELEYYFFFEEE